MTDHNPDLTNSRAGTEQSVAIKKKGEKVAHTIGLGRSNKRRKKNRSQLGTREKKGNDLFRVKKRGGSASQKKGERSIKRIGTNLLKTYTGACEQSKDKETRGEGRTKKGVVGLTVAMEGTR